LGSRIRHRIGIRSLDFQCGFRLLGEYDIEDPATGRKSGNPLSWLADPRNCAWLPSRYAFPMRVLCLCLILLTGCVASTKPPPPAQVTANDQRLAIRNQGYSLLHQLLADEGNVSKLLVVKNEADDLGALLKDISRTSADSAKQIEKFSKADPHLHLKMPGLPIVEHQTRDLIAKTKARELITKGGEKFEVRIVLSQAEALNYGAHLAAATLANETDPARKQFLAKTSEQYQQLHQRIIDLIHARWRAPQADR
jgi:hypothetical protein